MNSQALSAFIDSVEFPIDVNEPEPQQLVLRKLGEYVTSFDPVYSMHVEGDDLVVIGFSELRVPVGSFGEMAIEPYEDE